MIAAGQWPKGASTGLLSYQLGQARAVNQLCQGLRTNFAVTQETVKSMLVAALQQLAFNPDKEMLCAFHIRFKDIADSCPTALQLRDVVDLYLAALAKGDKQLALSIVMNQPVHSLTAQEL